MEFIIFFLVILPCDPLSLSSAPICSTKLLSQWNDCKWYDKDRGCGIQSDRIYCPELKDKGTATGPFDCLNVGFNSGHDYSHIFPDTS